jgi:hypothetical protein
MSEFIYETDTHKVYQADFGSPVVKAEGGWYDEDGKYGIPKTTIRNEEMLKHYEYTIFPNEENTQFEIIQNKTTDHFLDPGKHICTCKSLSTAEDILVLLSKYASNNNKEIVE